MSGLLSSSSLTQSGAGVIGGGNSSTPTGISHGSTTGGSRGGNKIQCAAMFASEISLTFQIHGIGKQLCVTVDIQAGLFRE